MMGSLPETGADPVAINFLTQKFIIMALKKITPKITGYAFVHLTVRSGEYEFSDYHASILEGDSHEEYALERAKNFYNEDYFDGIGDGSKYNPFYFNAGDVAVWVYNSKEITKEQYTTFNKIVGL